MNDKIVSRSTFETLSPGQQQQYYSENGFVLLPEVVSPEQMARIAAEVGGSERYDFDAGWPGAALEELVTNPRLLGLVRRCYGEEPRFFKAVYTEWHSPNEATVQMGRQRLHRDYTPDPEDGDFRNSCVSWCNVGHYFIDLEADEGPLWVVPGSHRLAWTAERHNFEQFAGDARMVLAKAGDAVMFHNRTMHAGGVMQSRRPRPSAFLSYRPAWAAPLGAVAEWPAQIVDGTSPTLRSLLTGQNDGACIDAWGIVQDRR